LLLHHPHPPHRAIAGIDLIAAHEFQLAVGGDAEQRQRRTGATAISRPLGSMWKVRGCTPCESMCWIRLGSPLAWSIAYTASEFSPAALAERLAT